MHGDRKQVIQKTTSKDKPLISIIVPAYNEATIIENNLQLICQYLTNLESQYRWEVIIINDGSHDDTANIADTFAQNKPEVRVLHHHTNYGLGQALRYAFAQSKGDYVVTMDIDLSYSVEHIEQLLAKITASKAKIVLTSPYMKDGRISNVPWLRRILSITANRFLSIMSHGHFSTLTGMVRVYDGDFIRSLDLRATGMDIMPEIIHKALIVNAKIEQIPAHLNWGEQTVKDNTRRSSMKVLSQIMSTLLSGFIFRPVIFFIFPGALLLIFALYVNMWMVIHFFESYAQLTNTASLDKATVALGHAYKLYPHTYLIGLLSLMLAIQLIGLGIQSLQKKKYFEELYHIAANLLRAEYSRNKNKTEL